jgi:hypothetical protein
MVVPVPKGRLLCREDIAQNVVDGDAHGADQNFTLGNAAVAAVSVVMIVVTAAGQLTGRRGHTNRPKQPSCNKNNTNNFGPHRSMFLSMGFNQ